MRVTAEESGEGDLTAKQLYELLQGLPENAVLRIFTDQRDTKTWRMTATWDSAEDGVGALNFTAPPSREATLYKSSAAIVPDPIRYGQFDHPTPPPWQT